MKNPGHAHCKDPVSVPPPGTCAKPYGLTALIAAVFLFQADRVCGGCARNDAELLGVGCGAAAELQRAGSLAVPAPEADDA